MARPKSLTDQELTSHVLDALASGGAKAASFGMIAQRCGLAPATLSQRFGSVEQMQRSAMLAEWARLTTSVALAEADALATTKGIQALLKTIDSPPLWLMAAAVQDPALAEAATAWRSSVETAIAGRKGGARARDFAAMIFAAWQGRQLWGHAGGKGFRLSDIVKATS